MRKPNELSLALMKYRILISLVIAFLFADSALISASEINNDGISVTLKNPLNISVENVIVPVMVSELRSKFPDFEPERYETLENGNFVISEFVKDYQSGKEAILLYLSFSPKETKAIDFVPADKEKSAIPKLTQAYLGEKKGYSRVDSFYAGGRFESVTYSKVPEGHWAHDGLYQYEGPGWESDRVGYRFYLDNRNRTDIFGKRTAEPVLDKTGRYDLESNGKESYTQMQDWGMDIFKVGSSLGIGAVAHLLDDSVMTISQTDSTICIIRNNGNLFSRVSTSYYGWNLREKHDIRIDLSIYAGSRLTKADIFSDGELSNITTGLAKHPEGKILRTGKENGKWNYLYLWGKQSLSGDSLGIAVLFENDKLIKSGEDYLSYYVSLRPGLQRLTYYFAAAWGGETGGIKTMKEFESYLRSVIAQLDKPIIVEY